MSQIFDALTRDREQRFEGTDPPTAPGEAVLATLGFERPVRWSRRSWPFLVVLALAALLLVGWIASRLLRVDVPAF
jgi:hypothetical protein